MNNVNLIGNMTADPELNYTASGQAFTAFTVAINRGKDKDGNDMGADFPRVTVWGKQAEACCRYLTKGRQVAVTGSIRTGSYAKDGQTHYTTDIKAQHVEFLRGGSDAPTERPTERTAAEVPDGFEMATDDLPF